MHRWLKNGLVIALLLGTAFYALAEDITLTTYYPSPRGVYQELKTAGDMVVGNISSAPGARLHVIQDDPASAVPVFRADDETSETSPFIVDATGNVGIGTPNPTAKLEVAGNVKIADGTQADGKVLTSDANGLASWQSAIIPSGAVMFFDAAVCPPEWTELIAARGRYLVGLPNLGSLSLQVGTELSNGEDRPTGRHTHTLNPPILNANREVRWYGGAGGGFPDYADLRAGGGEPHWYGDTLVGGIVIDPEGLVDGTPAPYLQLLVCKKD